MLLSSHSLKKVIPMGPNWSYEIHVSSPNGKFSSAWLVDFLLGAKLICEFENWRDELAWIRKKES